MNSSTFSIPWAAVYKADTEGVTRDLLFGRSDQTHGWKLVECTVAQTRYWACSTAQFTITRQILSESESSLNFNEELEPFLLPEDPIVIEMGYADSLFTDTVPAASKKRVFFGYVDTINVKSSARGVKVTVSCRDPLRFLIDNKFTGQLIVKPDESGVGYQISEMSGFEKVQQTLGSNPPDRAELESYMGMSLKSALRKDLLICWLLFTGSNGSCKPGKIIHSQESEKSLLDPSGLGLPNLLPSTAPDPGIEISTRLLIPPKDPNLGLSNYNIMNKFPLEVIKHIGSLEAEPREFYADVATGRICWRKRRLINKDNPVDLFFLKPGPQGQPPNVISAEIDWSSVGTVSEIVVVNPQAEATTNNQANVNSGILKVVGRLPDNRFYKDYIKETYGFRYFSKRTRYLFDETVSSENPTQAINLIDAMFRIWGKDLRAGTAVIPGNPFIFPGHAVRAHNFGLFDGFMFRVEAVTHKFTASGSAKGFRTSLAFAEPDEDRELIQDRVVNSIKAQNGKGIYLNSNDLSKANAGSIEGDNYQRIMRSTPGEY